MPLRTQGVQLQRPTRQRLGALEETRVEAPPLGDLYDVGIPKIGVGFCIGRVQLDRSLEAAKT